MKPKDKVLWYNELLRRCLMQTDDVDEAVRAADMAFAIEPTPREGVELAHDIYNRQAQGILNRAMRAAKLLGRNASEHLKAALRVDDPGKMLLAVIKWIEVYRAEMATLLTTTQLASLLEGAREVAKKIPAVPMFPHANPPATLEPKRAMELLERLGELSPIERDEKIINLPPDQQEFIRQGLIAQGQGTALEPPPFEPHVPAGENVSKVHFPVIDEAARELASKNVMNRYEFDALDASARQKAFTIASVDAEETLEAVRDVMARNIAEGVDLDSFRESVLKVVDESTFLNEGHLENVFRTNVQTAFSDGQMVVLNHPFVRSGFPYARYDAIRDDRVRHDHLEMEKYGIQGSNIYRVNDPVFQLFRPPWSWMCRCSWTPITIRQAAEDGIEEAKQWMATKIEPTPPAFVSMPPFAPPPTFRRSLSGAPLSVQLSCQSIYMDIDELRRYRKDKLKGGKADNRPDSDFEATALAKGIKVEMEHTNDQELAKEIAKDHLAESSRYYDELEKMEKVLSIDASGHLHKGKGEGGGQFTSGDTSIPNAVETAWHNNDIKVTDSFRSKVMPRVAKLFEKHANKLKIDKRYLRELLDDMTPEQVLSSFADPVDFDITDMFTNAGKLQGKLIGAAESAIDDDADDDVDDAVGEWYRHQLREQVEARKDEIKAIMARDVALSVASEPHDTEDLADLYAHIWEGMTPEQIGEKEIATVNDELADGEYQLCWDKKTGWTVKHTSESGGVKFSANHAPAGGIVINGKEFKGGQFIPSADYEKATPKQKEAIDNPKKARKERYNAKGSVDHDKIAKKLDKHKHHELTKQELASAKRSFNALHRHHGEHTLHRLEEIADMLQEAHDREGNTEGQTEQYSRRLRAVQHQIEMAKDKGVTGEVKKAEPQRPITPASEPNRMPPFMKNAAPEKEKTDKSASNTPDGEIKPLADKKTDETVKKNDGESNVDYVKRAFADAENVPDWFDVVKSIRELSGDDAKRMAAELGADKYFDGKPKWSIPDSPQSKIETIFKDRHAEATAHHGRDDRTKKAKDLLKRASDTTDAAQLQKEWDSSFESLGGHFNEKQAELLADDLGVTYKRGAAHSAIRDHFKAAIAPAIKKQKNEQAIKVARERVHKLIEKPKDFGMTKRDLPKVIPPNAELRTNNAKQDMRSGGFPGVKKGDGIMVDGVRHTVLAASDVFERHDRELGRLGKMQNVLSVPSTSDEIAKFNREDRIKEIKRALTPSGADTGWDEPMNAAELRQELKELEGAN